MPVSGLLILSIPNSVWFSAGLVATSVNYLWVLAASLLASIPAIFSIQRRPIKPWWYLLIIPAIVFAASAEIVAVLLAVLYLSAVVKLVLARKSYHSIIKEYVVLGAVLLFCAIMIWYHLTSPGNAIRRQTNWLFHPMPVILERSFSGTLRQVFMSGYLLPSIFFTMILLDNYRNRGMALSTFISALPLVGTLLLRDPLIPGTLGWSFQSLFSFGGLLWDPRDPAIPRTLYLPNLFAFAVLTILLVSAVYGIGKTSFARSKKAIILSILAAGFASKFITVNTVGEGLADIFHRTDTYLLFAFLISTLAGLCWTFRQPQPDLEATS